MIKTAATIVIVLTAISAPMLGPRIIREMNRRDTAEVRALEQQTAQTLAELAAVQAEMADSGRVSRWHDAIAVSLLVVRLILLLAGLFVMVAVPVLVFLLLYENEQARYRVLAGRLARARHRRDQARRRVECLQHELGLADAPPAARSSGRERARHYRRCG